MTGFVDWLEATGVEPVGGGSLGPLSGEPAAPDPEGGRPLLIERPPRVRQPPRPRLVRGGGTTLVI